MNNENAGCYGCVQNEFKISPSIFNDFALESPPSLDFIGAMGLIAIAAVGVFVLVNPKTRRKIFKWPI